VRDLWVWFATFTANYPLATDKLWAKCSLAHFWSLAIEEYFYLIAAPLVLFASKRRIAMIAVTLILCAIAWRLLIFSSLQDAGLARRITHGGLDLPLIGCLFAWAHTPFAPLWVRKALRIGGLIGLLTWLLGSKFFTIFEGGCPVIYASLESVLTGMALGTLAMILWAQAPPVLSHILGSAPLRWIGLRCYGLYAWHFMLLSAVPILLWRMGWHLSRFNQMLATLACTFLLAALSWRFIEQPMMNWGKKSRKQKVNEPQPPAEPVVTA
jgi:peptidoglycan/LPS O-acetylase OafA/YrhL